MRSRSSEHDPRNCQESDNLSKVKQEPPVSGAYIRSLVKQLTSSRTKDPMNPKDSESDAVDTDPYARNLAKLGNGFSDTRQMPPLQKQKKQVRRRLHTSRPYQERLLNMAEARREIVTALKFHRAAMKQAEEQQKLPPMQPPPQKQEDSTKARTRIYPSFSGPASFSNYMDNLSYSSLSLPPHPLPWPAPPLIPENLDFTLPNQALGLNLNFQDFGNLDATLYHQASHLSIYSYSSPSSSSTTFSVATEELSGASHEEPSPVIDVTDDCCRGGLHQAMDDEEMAEIRSIGKQHDIEWNDTMNLVTSAWWFKFSKSTELGHEVKIEDDEYHPFDEAMQFPAWLNSNEGCLQQNINYNYSDDCFGDPTLPCMDIGELEGMDGEWLA